MVKIQIMTLEAGNIFQMLLMISLISIYFYLSAIRQTTYQQKTGTYASLEFLAGSRLRREHRLGGVLTAFRLWSHNEIIVQAPAG